MHQLYMRYFDGVYGYARLALRDSHEAEDVAQQVFVNVFQALPRYELRKTQPFRAWLFRIARNAVVDSMRRQQRFTVEDPARIDLRRDAPVSEQARSALAWLSDGDMALFVERLPDAQRDLIVLRFMLDLRTDEIATILDRSPKAVRKLQERALRNLEERLVAVGRRPPSERRSSMLVRVKPAPVLAARRFSVRPPPRR
jgi:RNA polymerase sigma-70 factor, ECF subfamily